MTYKELAALAGVSVSTVSKVFSGSPEISQETKDRIHALAREHGVIRAEYHRSMPSPRIAILVPEIVSIFYAQEVSSLAAAVRRRSGEPAIYLTGFDAIHYNRVIDQLTQEKAADGILCLSGCKYTDTLSIPMVCTSFYRDSRYDTVHVDYQKISDDALRHLLGLGHRAIGFIGEKHTDVKKECFLTAMKKLQLPVEPGAVFISTKRFEEIGQEAARHYCRQSTMPTAFLCAYDEVALGAIKTFRKMGIRVPEDVSVIGMNDIPSAAYPHNALTTFKMPDHERHKKMVDCLFHHILHPASHTMSHTLLPAELIVRSTTGKVNKAERGAR